MRSGSYLSIFLAGVRSPTSFGTPSDRPWHVRALRADHLTRAVSLLDLGHNLRSEVSRVSLDEMMNHDDKAGELDGNADWLIAIAPFVNPCWPRPRRARLSPSDLVEICRSKRPACVGQSTLGIVGVLGTR